MKWHFWRRMPRKVLRNKKPLLKWPVGGGRKAMTDKNLRNKVVDSKIPFARIPIKGSR